VKHGETEFLVAEGDWPAMAEYMIQLAQDPALRARMGAAACKWAEENEDSAKNVLVLKSWLRAAAGLRQIGIPACKDAERDCKIP